jgi:hypothetical protein
MKHKHSAILRSFTVSLAVLAFAAILACYQKSQRDGASTQSIETASTAVTAASVSSGSEIYVEFRGTESWVFPTDTTLPDRVVIIKGNQMHEHVPQIVLPMDVTATTTDATSDLKKIFGSTAVDCTTPKACVVGLQAPVALRLVDLDGNPPSPPSSPDIQRTLRFKSLVPPLKAVSKDFGSAEMADLDMELKTSSGTYPKTATDAPFVAFFEINGGELDAKPACGRAAYISTDTSVTTRTFQEFANSVLWTGTTAKAVKLQVNRAEASGGDTGWQDITFQNSKFVHIYVLNNPKTSGVSDHFALHKEIGSNKSIVLPTFDHRQDCEHAVKSDVIGCSNTQWP